MCYPQASFLTKTGKGSPWSQKGAMTIGSIQLQSEKDLFSGDVQHYEKHNPISSLTLW